MLLNLTRQTTLAVNTKTALSFRDRLQGMIGRDFKKFDAMIFPKCSAIHTCFMQMPIDVVFLDKNGRILRQESAVRPWVFCISVSDAVFVIELPSGTLEKTGTETGDSLQF